MLKRITKELEVEGHSDRYVFDPSPGRPSCGPCRQRVRGVDCACGLVRSPSEGDAWLVSALNVLAARPDVVALQEARIAEARQAIEAAAAEAPER